MSEAPVIRQATVGDAAELARLRWDFSPDEVAAGGQPFDAFAAGFAAFLDEALAGGAWAIWVAADEGRLLGNLYLQTIAKSSPAGRLRPALRVHHQRLRRAGVARPGSWGSGCCATPSPRRATGGWSSSSSGRARRAPASTRGPASGPRARP